MTSLKLRILSEKERNARIKITLQRQKLAMEVSVIFEPRRYFSVHKKSVLTGDE